MLDHFSNSNSSSSGYSYSNKNEISLCLLFSQGLWGPGFGDAVSLGERAAGGGARGGATADESAGGQWKAGLSGGSRGHSDSGEEEV